jgi:hypothetical protein
VIAVVVSVAVAVSAVSAAVEAAGKFRNETPNISLIRKDHRNAFIFGSPKWAKPEYHSRYSDGLGVGRPVFDLREGQKIFLYCTVSRTALGPAGSLIPWILFLWCGGDVKLFTHTHLLPKSRMMELYLRSFLRLHGTVTILS